MLHAPLAPVATAPLDRVQPAGSALTSRQRLNRSPLPPWQDLYPPKDACVKVRVLRSHGSMALSHSAKVSLVKGSVHNMQCSEAEPLIRKGVLQVLDANC